MSKTLRTIATAICALFLLPLSAQERTDSLQCGCPANIAAFDLPWLAKYYGWDWKTDSLAASQTAW